MINLINYNRAFPAENSARKFWQILHVAALSAGSILLILYNAMTLLNVATKDLKILESGFYKINLKKLL